MKSRSILRSTQQLRRALALPVAAVVVLPLPVASPSYAQTLPGGAVVTAGKAVVAAPNGATLQVRQDSQRAVVRWSSFNIGQGAAVNFAQPNASAATLNVVTGAAPSELAGKLSANGSVFLINQNGIAITKSGTVDVRGGLVASTLGMSEDDFMNGRNVFQGKGAAVVNSGSIVAGEGGYVALLGSTVRNDGLIAAPLGKVVLASGQAVTLDLAGDGYLQVLLPADAAGADGQPLVVNSGSITADGGSVVLKAATVQQALREAVHMPGEIRARSVSGRDGAVVLEGGVGGAVRVAGSIDASATEGAASGGRIDIGGNSVALSGATLDASGSERGGLVRVGGAFQGGRAQQPGSADAVRYVERYSSSAIDSAAPTSAASISVDGASRIDVSANSANGEGGTAVLWSEQSTVMAGAIDGRGTRAGGAVEVSSASTIQSVALNRIALGKGGKLLLDPQDIEISDAVTGDAVGNVGYGDNSGGVTRLKTSDLTDLLATGASVSLKANQDISWNTFSAAVTPGGTTQGGDLALAAGRSITLSGLFQNAGGHWSMVANDSAANGVIDAQRGAGFANLDLRDARFINSNGRLDLTLADGAGNTNTAANRIYLPAFPGDGLSATVLPGASTGFAGIAPSIMLNNVNVANDVTLSGDLRTSASSTTLSGQRVDWRSEASGSISGEGRVSFLENGVTTRYGSLRGTDATRLALGQGSGTYSRVYGDADPGIATLGQQLLQVTAGTAPDALNSILQAGSLSLLGPGAAAAVGSYQLSLSATPAIAFSDGLMGGYFINLASASLPMTITRRTLTPTLNSAVSTVYGTAAPVLGLANLVNGDSVTPLATLDGAAGTALAQNGAGYGFVNTLGAGQHGYTLTGLGGAAAGNYQLDLGGVINGSFDITRKSLNYTMQGGSQTYGTLGAAPSSLLSGVLFGDDVQGVAGLSNGAGAVAHTARLAAGSYTASVTGLQGAAAANYQLDASGNSTASFIVDRRALTYSIGNVSSTYGTQAAAAGGTLHGVLSGDAVEAGAIVTVDGVGATVTPGARTAAGSYSMLLSGLDGASAGNYLLAPSGNSAGTLSIAPKVLSYQIDSLTQTYGSTALPSLVLNGVLSGDSVSAATVIGAVSNAAQAGASGALPVGEYTLGASALSGAAAANYVLGTGSGGRLTVQPKVITYSGGGAALTSTYGDTASVAPYVLSGVVGGDAISAVTAAVGAAGQQYALGPRLGAGSYTLAFGGLEGAGAGNYRAVANGAVAGSLSVARRTLTWSTPDTTVVYGDALDNSAITLNGVLSGDILRPVGRLMTSSGAAFQRPGVGNYVWSLAGMGGSLDNYVIATTGNHAGSVTVTPRQLDFVITDASATYGTAVSPTAQFLNLLPGDRASLMSSILGYSGDLSRLNVGLYTGQVAGVDNPNYMVNTGQPFDFRVNPRAVSWSGPALSMTYGDRLPSGAMATINGVLPGDDLSLQFNYDASSLPRSPSGNVNAGTHALGMTTASPFGASSRNYTVIGGISPGSLTVAPRTITYSTEIAAPFISTYGSVRGAPALSTVLNNVEAGDDVRTRAGAADFRLSSAGYLAAGTYTAVPGSLSGAQAGNYLMTDSGSFRASITVQPMPVSSAWRLQNMQNQTLGSLTYGDTGGTFVSSDAFQPLARDQVTRTIGINIGGNLVTALPNNLAVGDYGVTSRLSGADAGNYAFSNALNDVVGVVQVNRRPLSVQYTVSSSVYGAAPAISATLSGAVEGDEIGVTPLLTNSNGRPYGPGEIPDAGSYVVSPTQQMTGRSASQYVLAPEGASWTRGFDGATVSVGANRNATVQITPRYLPSRYSGPTSLVYGEAPGVIELDVSGVLARDIVDWVPRAAVNSWVGNAEPGLQLPTTGTRLPVGSYRHFMSLFGPEAGNYYTDASAATLTVTPRVVTAVAAGATTTYGTRATLGQGILTGVLSGETINAVPTYRDSAGNVIAYSDRTSAGSYTVDVTGLQGAPGFNARNYRLDTAASSGATLVVQPKTIDLALAASQTRVYGTSPVLGSRSGVLSGDEVAFTMAGETGGLLSSLESGVLFLDRKVDVGNYNYNVQLSGAAAGNYRLVNNSGAFSVTPKPLLWTVSAAGGQYGNYQECECTNPASGVVLGNAVFQGVLPGDDIRGSVRLLDLAGAPVTIDSRSPVGSYFQVVDGISGASVRNYTLSSSGNLPGIFNLGPLGISWAVSSGIIMAGYGVAGTPGVATLRGLLNGDVAAGVVSMIDSSFRPVSDMANLRPGRFYFRVTAIGGPNGGNYRPLSSTYDFWNNASGWSGPNEVGTLDVFADTTLGQSFTRPQALPVPPPVSPPPAAVTPGPTLSAGASGEPVNSSTNPVGSPEGGVRDDTGIIPRLNVGGVNLDPERLLDLSITVPVVSRGDDEDPMTLERQNPGTGADAGISVGANGVRAEAEASAEAGTSVTVGGATISTQAEVLTSAMAKFGVTGVTLEASVEGHVDVMLNYGPGYVTFGAHGAANASAKIGASGVVVEADASAATYVGGGAAGAVGGVGNVRGDATVGAYATVNADYKYGMIDGVLTMHTGSHVGVGVQAGVSGGISGGMGTVQGGATVMSPGTIGASFNFSAGYSNGTINFGLDIGAAIGIGGIELKLNIGINIGAVADVFSGLGRRTPDAFARASNERAEITRLSQGRDQKKLLEYLSTHSDWSKFGSDDKTFEMDKYKTLLADYSYMVANAERTLKNVEAYQTQVLSLMHTDPQAAVELVRNQQTAIARMQQNVRLDAYKVGLRPVVRNYQLTFEN